jgi:hypothetical protein
VKSRKMVEPHAQAWNARVRAALGMRCRTGTRGDTVGVGREWEWGPHGRQVQVGLGAGGRACESGWLGQSADSPVGSTFGSR